MQRRALAERDTEDPVGVDGPPRLMREPSIAVTPGDLPQTLEVAGIEKLV
jgi:hypothetical protein